MFLNEEADETLTVVDGNQRLLSIYNYVRGNYQLEGLATYPDLDGYFFDGLDPRFQRHIASRPLRFITIKKETHPQIKFDVFERINSGSVKLSAQELRHGIYYGRLIERVDKLVKEPWWRELASQGSDQRMKSAELVIRFWAFRYEREQYKKPLDLFLNEFVKRHRWDRDAQLDEWASEIRDIAEIATRLLGQIAFRTFDRHGKLAKLINSALFDAEMVGFAMFDNRSLLRSYPPEAFRERLRGLLTQDVEFQQAISRATSDERSVFIRFEKFNEFLRTL